MVETKVTAAQVADLLKKGKVAEATAAAEQLAKQDPAAVTASAEPPAPPAPRKPEEIILDLFKGIHSLLGNSPALVPLIAELQEVITPPAPEPATK